MDLGETLKESWAESEVKAPIAHAELMSLQEFATKIEVPVDQVIDCLKSKGYLVENAQQTLREIAEENRTSSDKLYEAIKSSGVEPVVPETIEGTGLGRKTLKTICAEKGLSLDDVLSRLKQRGITAQPNNKLRDVASKYEKTPLESFHIIEGKE